VHRQLTLLGLVALMMLPACGRGQTAVENRSRARPKAIHRSHKKHATTHFSSGPTASPSAAPSTSAALLYSAKCAACHGAKGEGGVGPPLNTSAVKAHFQGSEVKLAAFIQANMPFNDPKTLTPKQAQSLAAFIWKMAK
jgi:mono/diheme cytochrome c family protein